jgi:prolyl oligopeptidase
VVGAAAVLAAAPAAKKGADPAAQPPPARVANEVDTYFGKRITDPYRWMETDQPALMDWVHAQDKFTRTALARIPGRENLRKHIDDIAAHLTIVTQMALVGRRAFFLYQDAAHDLPALVVRDIDAGTQRVVLDPNKGAAGQRRAIDEFAPSQDGRYVAVGTAPGGSEEDVLHVIDADTDEVLPDTIDRARFASPSWLPDGRSFFYHRLRVAGPHEAPSERFRSSKVYIHHLGTDPNLDIPVFGEAVGELKTIMPNDFVFVSALTGTRYALGIQSDGVSPESAYYIAKLPDAGDTGFAWHKFADVADGVVEVQASRDTLFLRTHKNAPRYQVISVPMGHPDLHAAKLVVPQGSGVLTGLAADADQLYVAASDGASSFLQRIGADGKAAALKLPMAGTIGSGNLAADPRASGALVGIDTWVTPTAWFTLSGGDTPEFTDLKAAPPQPGAPDYLITETSALAKDGRTRLPLTIIEKKGTPHDHQRPVLVEGYGAYGISETPIPDWVPVVRGWVDAGGVMAISHIRGGGDLGEDWHQAGRKATKQNTIHDFIDSAWAMTKLGYASPATLAGMGTSAGGIAIGGAITQMPSLFRAALIRVGDTDTLRSETTEGGPANVGEFGTVTNQADFTALLAMDAYQHVKPGVAYPAVLLTAGAQDHRVPIWISAKMTARLQAAGKSKGPVLLRAEDDAGHGGFGMGRAQQDAEWADSFAFLLWQLGAGGFQPTK